MKPARVIVLIIALAAGGIAAFLASRSDQEPPPELPPVAQIETVDVLVANNDINVGAALSAQDMRWQTWPVASASANFLLKSDRPEAIQQLAGAISRQAFLAG